MSKKYKFKLQSLLRLREFREHKAKLEIAEINQVIKDTQDKIALERKEIDEAHHSMEKMVEAGISGEMISFFPFFIKGKEENIKQLEEKLENTKRMYEQSLVNLSEARGEVKLIEKMKEKDFEKYKKETRKKEQEKIDDILQTHIFKKRNVR